MTLFYKILPPLFAILIGSLPYIQTKKWLDKRTKKNQIFRYILLSILLISIVAIIIDIVDSDAKQKISDKEKMKADSSLYATQLKLLLLQNSTKDIIIKKVESAYTNSIKASNEALAKYNLKITDSLHSVVNKININSINPQLSFLPLAVGKQRAYLIKSKDRTSFCVNFISTGGTSYNVKINCYFILNSLKGYSILASDRLTFGNDCIIENVQSSRQLEILMDLLKYPELLVFLTGTFSKDPQGKYLIPFNGIIVYNFKDDKYINTLEMEYDKLKILLNIQ